MDPRLNPSLTPKPQNVMQDVTPAVPSPPPAPQPAAPPVAPPAQPAAQPPTTATNPIAVADPMPTQIVGNIPLRLPEGVTAQVPSAPPPNANPEREDDLDKILKAVNNKVNNPNQTPE
ncbi:hypothetical protein KW789_02275, partial [Candidatus Saccharibacteria bacterium]|nr:hypothetical protein [Candidatus Saccharibacteria bacterium]